MLNYRMIVKYVQAVFSSNLAISSKLQTLSDTPASISGVSFKT